jgi:hypothetical protein
MKYSSGSRFRVQGSRFKVPGSGFKVQRSRFRVQVSEFKVQGSAPDELSGVSFKDQGSDVGVQNYKTDIILISTLNLEL